MTVRSLSASGLDSEFVMVGCGWTVRQKLGEGGKGLESATIILAVQHRKHRPAGPLVRGACRESARSTFVLLGVHSCRIHSFAAVPLKGGTPPGVS